MFIGRDTTSQLRRSGGWAAESVKARRGGEGLGRIATGWVRVRGGLLDAERGSREDAEGSWTCPAGDCGEYVYA